MQDRPPDILLAEPDIELATLMRRCLREAMACTVTSAADAAAVLREELTARHDVLMISMDLPDAAWPDLVRELRLTNRAPLILLATDPSVDDLLQAMRMGAMEILLKPFDTAQMCVLVQRTSERALARQRARTRRRRLRRLTSKIIRERRDLRQRIDLICQDFVHAYRRLAQRVSEADLLPHE
ncbi:MAG: response regulator [Planctomycetes bacterium]|nr:response regulator [Planctomycetota bacterium]